MFKNIVFLSCHDFEMCNDVSLVVSFKGVMLAGNICGGRRQHDAYVIRAFKECSEKHTVLRMSPDGKHKM